MCAKVRTNNTSGDVEPLSDTRKHSARDNQGDADDRPTQFPARAVFTQPEDTERSRNQNAQLGQRKTCLLYTSPSPRD